MKNYLQLKRKKVPVTSYYLLTYEDYGMGSSNFNVFLKF